MRRLSWLLVLVLSSAPSCGGDDDDGGDGGADAPPAETTDAREDPGQISIASPAFESEGEIPKEHGLEGGNVSPPLSWNVDLPDAAELVVALEDYDAPGEEGPFVHWLVAGIDPSTTGTPEGAVPTGAVEGTTDFGEVGYGGPAPPGGERHRYVFQVIALDAPSGLEPGFTEDDLRKVIDDHFLVSAEYAGFFKG